MKPQTHELGKLVQIKPIAAGEALTLDYGVDYWVYQLSRQTQHAEN